MLKKIKCFLGYHIPMYYNGSICLRCHKDIKRSTLYHNIYKSIYFTYARRIKERTKF